jgi:hypothetical protein
MVSEKDKEQESESAFKVTDRRQFNSEGEARPLSPKAPGPSEKIPEKPSEEPAKADDSEKTSEKIDFSQFVYSLATTTMVHLGEIAEPTTGQKMENIEAARQMIDILSILQEKTKGNLTSDEKKLLEGLLYELHMKFVSKNKAVSL